MPMNKPAFTTNPDRIARLQANYDDGLAREGISSDVRDKFDTECLVVSDKKLKFLYQNAMEGYGSARKNELARGYDEVSTPAAEVKEKKHLRFL